MIECAMAFMTKHEIILKYVSTIIATSIAILNIFLVRSVFKFNRKMGHSKLSIKTSLINEKFASNRKPLLDFTYNLDYLLFIDQIKGLPVIDYQERTNMVKNFLTVNLDNKGELPSTNIQVTLILKAYRTRLREETNKLDSIIINQQMKRKLPMSPILERRFLFQKKIIIKIPYIGAEDNKKFVIAPIIEQFRETELILVKIKANGHTYFKRRFFQSFFRPVVINHHLHPFLENPPSDGSDLKKFIGAENPDQELSLFFKEKFRKRRFSDWLLSLFAEWRR